MKDYPIIRWFLNGRRALISILLLTLFVGVGIFAYGHGVHAADIGFDQCGGPGTGAFGSIGCYIRTGVAIILDLIVYFLGILLTETIAVFLWIAQYNDFINSIAVVKGWVVVRDVSNMFFVVILLVAAVGTIFGSAKYTLRSGNFIRRFIIVALLVNFSRTICGIMIDASQVVMLTFVGAIANVGAGNFAELLGMHSFLTFVPPGAGTGSSTSDVLLAGGANYTTLIAAYMLASMMMTVALVVMGVMIAFVAVRIIAFWMLIVFSPLAMVFSITPKGEEYYKMWWKEFFNYLVCGPAMAFCLWLSFAIVSQINAAQAADDVRAAGLYQVLPTPPGSAVASLTIGGTIAGSVQGLSGFVFGIGMLVASLTVGSKMGGAASGLASKASKKVSEYTYGKPLKYVGEKVTSGAKKVAGTTLGLAAGTLSGIGRGIKGAALQNQAVQRAVQGYKGAAAYIPLTKEWRTNRELQRGEVLKAADKARTDGKKLQTDAQQLPGKRLAELDNNVRQAREYAAGTTQQIADIEARAQQLSTQAAATPLGPLRDRLEREAAAARQEATDLRGMVDAATREANNLEASRDQVRKQAEREATGMMGQAAAKENAARLQELKAAGLAAMTGASKLASDTLKMAATGGVAFAPQVLAAAENLGASTVKGSEQAQLAKVKKAMEDLKGKTNDQVLSIINGVTAAESPAQYAAAVAMGAEKKLIPMDQVKQRAAQATSQYGGASVADFMDEQVEKGYPTQGRRPTPKKAAKQLREMESADDLKPEQIDQNMFLGFMQLDSKKKNEFLADDARRNAFTREALKRKADIEAGKDGLKAQGADGKMGKEMAEAINGILEAATRGDASTHVNIDMNGSFSDGGAMFDQLAAKTDSLAKMLMALDEKILAKEVNNQVLDKLNDASMTEAKMMNLVRKMAAMRKEDPNNEQLSSKITTLIRTIQNTRPGRSANFNKLLNNTLTGTV